MTAARTLVARIPPRWAFFGAAVTVMLAVGLWLRTKAPALPPASPAVPPSSIVVLPFRAMSPDTVAKSVGVGIADMVSGMLGDVSGLRVAGARSAAALAARGDSLRAVGRRLGVGSVLDGAVRYSADRMRVTARLVSVEEGFDLWSEVYDVGSADLVTVPQQIAGAAVEALRQRGGVSQSLPAQPVPTRSIGAFQQYLMARAADRPEVAVPHLTEALRLDPKFPLAQAALARAYIALLASDSLPPSELMPRARGIAETALTLDSTLVEPHVTLGIIDFLYQRAWSDAEEELERALQRNPSLAEAHLWHAKLLLAVGRPDEAMVAARRARALEPASLEPRLYFAWHNFLTRQYDAARTAAVETAALFPTAWQPLHLLGLIAQAAGDTAAAAQYLADAHHLAPAGIETLAAQGWAQALAGHHDEARRTLVELRTLSRERYVSPVFIAYIHAALGERRAAFAWLARGIRERAPQVVYLRNDPRVDPLRKDPRYPALLRELDLPRP